MARPRKGGVQLPPHVHAVTAKSKTYYFYQPFRGTARQGERVALPRDPQSVEFWDAVRRLAGTVPGYSGTIAAMIDAFIASTEYDDLSASTKRSYRLYLGHARLAVGKHAPDALRPAHVIALRDEYKETPRAANTIMAALSACYRWGRPRDLCTGNPCSDLPKFKGKREWQPWPDEVIDLMLESARWEVKRFILLTLHTGQRCGDVCGMTLRDIDEGFIRVVQQKTKKDLWIPLHPDLLPMVEEARQKGVLALIPRGNGSPHTAEQFSAMFRREIAQEKFKVVRELGLVPHGLCKNAHNRLFEAGNNEKEVQSVTGRSPQMVAHYSKGVNQRKLATRAIGRVESRAKSFTNPQNS